jgi:hypothetical protein
VVLVRGGLFGWLRLRGRRGRGRGCHLGFWFGLGHFYPARLCPAIPLAFGRHVQGYGAAFLTGLQQVGHKAHRGGIGGHQQIAARSGHPRIDRDVACGPGGDRQADNNGSGKEYGRRMHSSARCCWLLVPYL